MAEEVEPRRAQDDTTTQWRTFRSAISGLGMETRPRFFRAPPTRSGRCRRCESRSPVVERACGPKLPSARARQQRYALEDRQGRKWTMGSLRLVTILLLLGSPAFAQSPHMAWDALRPQRIRRMDISIGATGGAPSRPRHRQGGAQSLSRRGASPCHGPAGLGGMAPELQSKKARISHLATGAHPATALAVCDDVWITSIAACLPGMRGLSPPMRSIR